MVLGKNLELSNQMYPGVPNTISASRETDSNYGIFKYLYQDNVNKFAWDREQLENSKSISIALFGMFVFGGTDPETGCKYNNAFVAAFCKANNLGAWKKVGDTPLTRVCLDDSKVSHEMGTNVD